MSTDGSHYTIHSNHPWALIPALIDAGVLTPEEARDGIVLAHQDGYRSALREIMALLPELLAKDLIADTGVDKIRAVVMRAQAQTTPDGQ